ncbi:MAG: hypothetical protein CMO61_06190 [Verrucomicrobiales bacterium]|jgi:hypothetical protein|nr:hypothetical protein [Verrucomicrobiales bacterium]
MGAIPLLSTSCVTHNLVRKDTFSVLKVSVPTQEMILYKEGKIVKTYPVSTSKFGLGNEKGSYHTPLGRMQVAEKIGGGTPAGAVFKSRKWTGEVIKPDSPGRDPIVSRILWLRGTEKKNDNTYSRCIYIHGTAAEKDIGKPVSYGCIRMTSNDVIDLYRKVGEGATVYITKKDLTEELLSNPRIGDSGEVEIEALPLGPADSVISALQPTLTSHAATPEAHNAHAPTDQTTNTPAALPFGHPASLANPETQFQPRAPARIAPTAQERGSPEAGPVQIPPANPAEAPMKREFRPFRMSSS